MKIVKYKFYIVCMILLQPGIEVNFYVTAAIPILAVLPLMSLVGKVEL